jgi:hypothetical protein
MDGLETLRALGYAEQLKPLVPGSQAGVYWVVCGPYVKIGFAAVVSQRLASLAIGNPFPLHLMLVVPGGKREERKLHERFEAHRHRGEWFHLGPELCSYMVYLDRTQKAEALEGPTGVHLHEQARAYRVEAMEAEMNYNAFRECADGH